MSGGPDVPGDPDGPLRPELMVADDELAPVWKRVVARVLTNLFWIVLTSALFTLVFGAPDPDSDEPVAPVAALALALVLPMLIDVALVATKGWDPGKAMLNLRVAGEAGVPPGWQPALVRTLVIDGPRLLVYVPLIGIAASWLALPWLCLLIWTMVTGPRHQGWQDRAAHTWVLQRERRPRAPLPDRGE